MSSGTSNKPYHYNYIFVVTGYNCQRWVDRCIKSIIKQNLKIWHCILCDDASSDDTWNIMSKYVRDKRFSLLHNRRNMGACYSRWAGIKMLSDRNMIDDEDVLLLIGADDRLSGQNVLTVVDTKYRENAAEVTYGNWQDEKTKKVNPLRYFPMEVLKNRTYREHPVWVATAINTFRYRLFRQIDPLRYFRDEKGAWIKNCTDLAVMFPVLEMADPSKIIPIATVLYIYNSKYGHNTKSRFGKQHKQKFDKLVRQMTPFHKLITSPPIQSDPIPPVIDPTPPIPSDPIIPKIIVPTPILKPKTAPKHKNKKAPTTNKNITTNKPKIVKSTDGKYIVYRTRGGTTINIKREQRK